jgi:glycosyltransferase involved in cell wall biosynthesis
MKILIISYWFLPSHISNAKRPFYFAEAFLKEGWSVDVVASYAGMTPGQNELLFHPNLNIRRIEDPLDAFCRKLSGFFKTAVSRCSRYGLWPDEFVGWAAKILFRVKPGKYDRVILCLRPESLLLFSFFKRISDRWIIDCQEVFYPVFIGNRRSPVLWLLSPLLTKLQRHVFKKAGCVLFTSESARKEYIRRKLVDADKTVHVPLFFDEKAYKNVPLQGLRFLIAYFGLFGYRNGVRSPEPFFQALKLFLERNPAARSQTVFIFHGRGRVEKEMEIIERLGLRDVVEMHPPVPYEQYLELLAEASVLLLLVSSQHNFFMPGKMIDYFGAQRPILGFVPLDSETYSTLKDANMAEYVCGEQEVERGAENIEKLWNKWIKGRPLCENSKTAMWSAAIQIPRVLEILNSTSKYSRKG